MIRLGKPVQLFEWGHGTTTMNQNWHKIGEGVLHDKPKWYAGATVLHVEVDGQVIRTNPDDDTIKVCQPGEAMTPTAPKMFGEVAVGKLKSIKSAGNKTLVEVQLIGAAKVG
jgi:hypothetical protein